MTLNVTIVQKNNEDQHEKAVIRMFEQRARIFRDKLGWDVTVYNGQETDQYDDLDPVYLICTDELDCLHCGGNGAYDAHWSCQECEGTGTVDVVTGSLRLLPTTGPTLLADAFADTLPDAMFSAPTIWECTRFCAEDHDTAAALIAALGDVALKSGIESIVGNFDAAMLRVYARIGCEVEVLGKARRDGRTVYLGIFPVTAEILRKVKSRMAAMARVAA